jgi:penicillin amidase
VIALLIIIAVPCIVAAALLYLRYRFRLPLPRVEGTATVSGLSDAVEVIRDRWGVPHIYAANLPDLFFAHGYVQAQDRLWQMELNRRLSRGRLSEIFGGTTLEMDRFTRTVGISRAAEKDLACLREESRALLEAFRMGVNSYREQNPRKLPIEFKLLGFKPEPWELLDSLAWMKMQAWYLSENWTMEILNAAMVGKVGPQRAARLIGAYPEQNPVTLARQTVIRAAERALEVFADLQSWFPADALSGRSNCWAVRGSRSVSGKVLFAYDPHLGLTVPSLWYAAHLVCPKFDVVGATFPGIPGIIVGHNRDIAFGFTNAFSDVQDLYLERFNPRNALEYEHNGKWLEAERVVEEVRVKGERHPHRLEVVLTRHGPLVGELLEFKPKNKHLGFALRWTGLEGSDPLAALLALDRAGNWSDYCTAMSLWDAPSQNGVYADRKGNIGYTLVGKIPVRKRGIGLVPVPGWNDDHEWTGWIPWGEMPREYNPRRGYLVSANNQIVGKEYPHYIGLGTCNGNRAARIEELIKAKDKLSLNDFAAMQMDLHSLPAKRFAALLTSLAGGILKQRELAPVREQAAAALEMLKGWQGELTPGSAAAALYSVCEYHAKRRLFEPWLGDMTQYYCGRGMRNSGSISLYMEYSHLVLLEVLEQDDGAWLATPDGQRRSREQLLAAALRDALRYLSKQGGKDPRRWQYGSFHKAWFIHPIGRRRPFDLLFNSKPVSLGGSADTVWQSPPLRSLPPQKSTYSASWRQLVDFSNLEGALWVHTSGQSGHPASRYYKDLVPLWASGRYRPMLWSREQVEAEAEGRLTLVPGESVSPSRDTPSQDV